MAVETHPLPQTSWRTYLRATYMIALKDWKHYWRYPLNVFTTILQPLIWLTPVYFMGQAFSVNGRAEGFAGYSGTTDYISFILIGMVMTNYIQTVFWGMGFSLKNDMNSGVMELNWLAPLPRPLMLIARTFTNLLITTIVSLVMLAIASLIFGFHPSGSVLAAVLTALPMLLGLYGFGIAFAAIVLLMRDANTLVDMSSFLVNIFSGSDFPVNALPRFLMPISLAIPLTYGYDALRGILIHTRTILPIPVEIGLLLVFMLGMAWLGTKIFNNMERKVRTLGTLGQH